jgi:hypothetical protein
MNSTVLLAADVGHLDAATAQELAAWATCGCADPEPSDVDAIGSGDAWLIAETGTHLIVGHRPAGGPWTVSADVSADPAATVWTVRVFGPDAEILVRLNGDGVTHRARRLRDRPTTADPDLLGLSPVRERRLLIDGVADIVTTVALPAGFSAVRVPGRELRHHLPCSFESAAPDGRGTVLVVRDYLGRDGTTGQVRYAATRCAGFSQRWKEP